MTENVMSVVVSILYCQIIISSSVTYNSNYYIFHFTDFTTNNKSLRQYSIPYLLKSLTTT